MIAKLKGIEKVTRNLNKEIKKIKGRTVKGMIKANIIIRRGLEAKSPTVPVDTGNLRSSYFCVLSGGKVGDGQSPSFKGPDAGRMSSEHSAMIGRAGSLLAVNKQQIGMVLGFSAYYAWVVHEMVGGTKKGPINWQRPGSGSKFLQTRLEQDRKQIISAIASEAKVK